jgi:hypothetical protein
MKHFWKKYIKILKNPCFPFTEIDPDLGLLITEIKKNTILLYSVIFRPYDNTQVWLENGRFFRFFILVRNPWISFSVKQGLVLL